MTKYLSPLNTAMQSHKEILSDKLWLVYLIVLIEAILSLIFFPESISQQVDSASFIITLERYEWLNPWSWIGSFRTPVYPIFYGFCRLFRFMPPYMSVIFFQWVIFGISVCYLNRISRLIISSVSVRKLILFIYVLYPGFYECNNLIMSESTCMCIVVFLIYALFMLMATRASKYAIWSGLWLSVLLLLKPAMIFLLVILLVGWLLYLFKDKKTALKGLISTIAGSLIIFAYMGGFYYKYGWFASSTVSDYNVEHNLRFFHLDNLPYEDPYLMDATSEGLEALKKLTPFQRHELVTNNLIHVKSEYASLMLKNISTLWRSRAFDWRFVMGAMSFYLTPEMGALCIILIIYSCLLIFSLSTRRRQNIYPSILLCAIWCGNFLVVWFGSFCYLGGYGRLMQPVAPVFLLIVGQLCSLFSRTRSLQEILSLKTSQPIDQPNC